MKRLESQLLDIESSIETLEAEQLTPGHYDDVNRVVEVAHTLLPIKRNRNSSTNRMVPR